jgi:sulfite exporter TauE/SafE/copper chaperone CopZ
MSEKNNHKEPVCLQIRGMTCRSCEIFVERKLRQIPGIQRVDVNAATGKAMVFCDDVCHLDLKQLQETFAGETYQIQGMFAPQESSAKQVIPTDEKPSFLRVIGLFALVFLIASLLKNIGIFPQQTGIEKTMTLAAAVVLGFVAGSSSCLAVSGGLLLSSVGKFRERYGNASPMVRMRPVFMFVVGRFLSYALLGGIIGWVGKAFTFSPIVTGTITILAALYMLAMGLEMLRIAPQWLKERMPRMPKGLSHRIMDAEGNEHWAAPFLLGAATFFLPCGFTQSLQVFALTTGSFMLGASILGGFAIGTAPALLLLGWASSSLKGNAGKFFLQFSGAVVVVLGIWNIQNGLAIAGHQLSFDSSSIGPVKVSNASGYRVVVPESDDSDENIKKQIGEKQVVQLRLIDQAPFYAPTNQVTVSAGKPVHLEIFGRAGGCRSVFQIPGLRVQTLLSKEKNVVEFTPKKPGQYTFSCSMGMYRGILKVN